MVHSRSSALLGFTLAGIASAVGCGQSASSGTGGADGGAPAAVGATGGTFTGGAPGQGATAAAVDGGFCSGSGPLVVVGDADGGAGTSTCTGQIAEATFKSALCTCRDVNLQGYLRTRGFDSTKGPYVPGSTTGGAPVGVDHDYVIPALGANAGFTDVGGSFSVAGPDSISFAGALSVDGDFRAAGRLDLKGYSRIARNAWIGGDVSNLGYATVGGDLHISGNDMLPLVASGIRKKEPVSVAPPCDCNDLLDVAALVDHARTSNDNASIGLAPGALRNVIGLVERTLPCGKYYVDALSGIGDIVLHVNGRVALFVEGSVSATGNLEVDLAPGAEIDVFIKGTLALTGRGAFGTPARPAATRLYVGGSGDVTLVGASGFVGNLYAPRARVTAIGYASVYGSVFARDFVVPGFADIVYDRAITHAGDGCNAPPPATCKQCGTCTGGTACVNGACGKCTTDGDCCGQDVCVEGACKVLIK